VDAELERAQWQGAHAEMESAATLAAVISAPGRVIAQSSQQHAGTPVRGQIGSMGGRGAMQTPVRAAAGNCSVSGCVSVSTTTRPQLRWRDEVDNSERPFIPKLRAKPNALVPLQLTLALAEPATAESPMTPGGSNRPLPHNWYSNPYEHEIAAFKPSESELSAPPVKRPYPALHLTPCHWVDTEAALQQLGLKLSLCTEFALAIQHHVYRSYKGFVCLLQISTREESFLVDTLEVRSGLYMLNEVFTNPRITKLMHGSDSDVLWLQRDFGIYLVGLFDLGQAARVLELPSFSRSHLLHRFCNVTMSKAHQLSDWRLRPLPEQMLYQAREETHYLPYLYDRLREEMEAQELVAPRGGLSRLTNAWQRSAELSRQAYKVYPFEADEHLALCRRQNAALSPQQLAAHRALFCWRDALAREEDESLAYVLPNHLLLKLAQALPRSVEQLHVLCQPLTPLLVVHARSLLAAVAGAEMSGDCGAQTPGRGFIGGSIGDTSLSGVSLDSFASPLSGLPRTQTSSYLPPGMPTPSSCGTYSGLRSSTLPSPPAAPLGAPMWPAHHPMQPALPNQVPHQTLNRQFGHGSLALSLQEQLMHAQQLPLPPPMSSQPPFTPQLPQQLVPMQMPPPRPVRLGMQGYGGIGSSSGSLCSLGSCNNFAGSSVTSINLSSEPQMPSLPGSKSSHMTPPAAGTAPPSACRVRCPPSPSRSPPMHIEQLYAAAGWLSNPPTTEHAVHGNSSARSASGRSVVLSCGSGSGLFSSYSSGSSDDEEPESAAAKASAKSIQAKFSTSPPLWVLGLFAPQPGAVLGPVEQSAAAGGGKLGSSGEPSVPRSLDEIYKLSNLNKRRGAASRKPSEELYGGVASSDSDDEGKADNEARGDGADDSEHFSEDIEGSKRSRSADASVNEGTEANSATKEHTEDFMRRIGWLRAETNTADSEMTSPQPLQQQQPEGPPMPMTVPKGSSGASPPRMHPMTPQMPPMPQMHNAGDMFGAGGAVGSIKAAGRPKKRSGFGSSGATGVVERFDYDAATAASCFVYSMQQQLQQRQGGYGKGGERGGKGGGGRSRGRGGR